MVLFQRKSPTRSRPGRFGELSRRGELDDGGRHVPRPVLANRPQVLQAKLPDKALPIASSRLPRSSRFYRTSRPRPGRWACWERNGKEPAAWPRKAAFGVARRREWVAERVSADAHGPRRIVGDGARDTAVPEGFHPLLSELRRCGADCGRTVGSRPIRPRQPCKLP